VSNHGTVTALLKVVAARFKVRSSGINRGRDSRYKWVAQQSYAGGCMGRAAKRLEALEDFATRKALAHVEIYKAVSEEFGSSEMLADDQLALLVSTIKTSVGHECASVRQMSERDCNTVGQTQPQALKALGGRYSEIESRIVGAAKDQIELLRAEFAARDVLPDGIFSTNLNDAPVSLARRPASAVAPDLIPLPVIRSAPAIHIDALMKECDLTQEELAAEMNIEPSQVSRHISGKSIPGLKSLRKYDACFSRLMKKQIVVNRNATKRN
jgi:hypothetical protein